MARSCEDHENLRCEMFNKSSGNLKGYDCPLCNNRGYFLINKNGDEFFKECKCMVIRKNISQLKKSGLYQQIKDLTFDNYIVKANWQRVCKEKAQKFNCGWFYAGGQSGVGKTHLCIAIVGKLISQGKNVKYMLWRDEIVKLKQNVNNYEEYSSINYLKNVDALYIDDFFKTERGKQVTQADINIAFELLNYRYNNKELITIISSELMTSDLIDIDEAIAGRIIEMSKGNCLDISKDINKNYRLNN